MQGVDVEKIVGGVGPCPGVALSVAAAHGTVGSVVARTHVAGERLVEELHVLHTDVALQRETLHGHDFQIAVAEDTPRGVLVVAHVVERLYGVLDVASQHGHGVGIDTRRREYGDGRVLAHSRVRNTTVTIGVGATVVPFRNHQVLTHADVLIKVISRVHTGGDALVERVGHQTILVDVVGR